MSRRSSFGFIGEAFAAVPPIFKLLVVLLLVHALLVVATGSVQLRVFRNTAIIKAVEVGVYEDAGATVPVDGIDWGVLEPGGNQTEMMFVRNEGNCEFRLLVYTVNWMPPEAEHYLNLTSDYQGQPILVGETVRVELTLALAPVVWNITSFGFDLVLEVE